MSYDGIGTEATIDRDSVESMAQGPIGEIGADAEETSGGDVRNGEEQSNASRSGGATGGGRRILPRGNDTLVETLRSADSNRLRVLGISEEQRTNLHHWEGQSGEILRQLRETNDNDSFPSFRALFLSSFP